MDWTVVVDLVLSIFRTNEYAVANRLELLSSTLGMLERLVGILNSSGDTPHTQIMVASGQLDARGVLGTGGYRCVDCGSRERQVKIAGCNLLSG